MHNFRRSRSNRLILGVCGGMGQYFNLNAWLFRFLFIILSIPSLGLAAIIYLILGMVIPEEEYRDPFEQIFSHFSSYHHPQSKGRKIKEAEKVDKNT